MTPILLCNGKRVSLESRWEPDSNYAYERLPVHYHRLTRSPGDQWTVRIPEALGGLHILPAGSAQVIRSSGEEITFQLTQAGDQPFHLAVMAGEQRLLFLFVDPPGYQECPADAHHGDRFGILPDTGERVSDLINSALEKIASEGGGTLHLAAGMYRVGTIRMRDNTFLHLAEGAVLQAGTDVADFPEDPPGTEFTDLPRSLRPGARRRMILFDHVRNSGIRGKGVIDANGSEMRRLYQRPRAALNHIRMVGCEDIALEGIILRDSEFWCTHMILCKNVRISGVKVVNEIPPLGWDRDMRPESNSTWNNADGINPDSSQAVMIEHCFLHTGDDCVPIKNTACYKGKLRDVCDITVRSTMMLSSVTAMKLGTETLGDRMENILFEDIEVVQAARAIATDLKDGIRATRVTFRDIRVHRCNRPFDLWIIPREDHPKQLIYSNLDTVIFENVNIARRAIEPSGSESHINGHDSQHSIDGVLFRNVRIEGRLLDGLDFPGIVSNQYVKNVRFE